MIPNEVTILCWSKPESSDLNLVKLAEFLGLKTRLLTMTSESASPDYLERNLPPHPVCLVTSGSTIAQIFSSSNFNRELKTFLLRRIAYWLIHTVDHDPSHAAALSFLSGGALTSMSPVQDRPAEYQISPNERAICGQLAGLSSGPVNSKTDLTMLFDGNVNGFRPLITIGTKSFFGTLRRDECSLFVVGCNRLADIDESASPASSIRSYFSRLIPVMMFLKHVFKDRAWHAQKPYASFTIDDPLLQERYGFLDYRKLLETMDSSGFSTTIAFIPWNFKRTDSAIAALLRSRPDKFSLVVHGCDHTGAEFNSNDVRLLSRRVGEAVRRMNCHQNTTGLPFERVMIFPQGRFSTAAMRALKANNFLAAVNTTALPDCNPRIQLRLRDLLDVAILNYETFPLFIRRYPRNLFDCALDLFLGKPLLLVEHHEYFRNGYDEIGEFAARVNALDKNISWQSLGQVLDHAVLRKTGTGEDLHMKLYSHNASILGETEQERTYHISKVDSNNLRVNAITLSGESVPFTRDGNALTLTLHLPKGATSRLEITFENPWNESNIEYRVLDRIRIFGRRHLTEIRDNYIARSESLLSLSHWVKGFRRDRSNDAT